MSAPLPSISVVGACRPPQSTHLSESPLVVAGHELGCIGELGRERRNAGEDGIVGVAAFVRRDGGKLGDFFLESYRTVGLGGATRPSAGLWDGQQTGYFLLKLAMELLVPVHGCCLVGDDDAKVWCAPVRALNGYYYWKCF